MKTKRILIVSPFPPYIGGVSVSSQRLYDRLLKDGFEVAKYSTRYKTRWFNKYRFLKLLRHLFLPFYLLSKNRYDVIHFHISGSYLRVFIGIFRPLFSRKTTFISTVHGDVKCLLDTLFGKYCFIGFDRVICVKVGDKERLKKYYNGMIKEIPAYISPVEKSDFEKLIPIEVYSFINSSNSNLITHTGFVICNDSYYDLYGIKSILQAFLILIAEGVDCKLLVLLLGELNTDAEVSLFNDIKEISVHPLIRNKILIHKVSNTELWPILKKTSVFIRPTKTDGDALSVRESLSFGVSTIASDVITRPEGTELYDVNSVEDLALTIKRVLMKSKGSKCVTSESFYGNICEMYN